MPEEKKVFCPICRSPNSVIRLSGSVGQPFSIVECGDCQTIFADPPPDDDFLKRFYNEEYRPDTYRQSSGKINGINRSIINLIKKSAGPGSMSGPDYFFYEIGYGTKEFLEQVSRLGVRVGGCEIKNNHFNKQIQVGTGFFENFNYKNIFDCVYASHVLEHSSRPDRLARAILNSLKPGGLAIIKVPSKNSLTQKTAGRLMKEKGWPQFRLEYPDHLFCFSSDGLRDLFQKTGFTVKTVTCRSDLVYDNYFMQLLVIFAKGLLFRLPGADKTNRLLLEVKKARQNSPVYRLLKTWSRLTTPANTLLTGITGKFWPRLGEEIFLVAQNPEKT